MSEAVKTLGMGTALAVLGALILMFAVPGAAAPSNQWCDYIEDKITAVANKDRIGGTDKNTTADVETNCGDVYDESYAHVGDKGEVHEGSVYCELQKTCSRSSGERLQARSIEGLKRLYEKENATVFWPYLCSALSAAPDYKGPAAKRYRSDCIEDFGHKGPALPIKVK